jgi:hypothetical protein
MEEFNQFLSLSLDGNTLYFGDIRENRGTLASYFEAHSGKRFPQTNPTILVLQIIRAAQRVAEEYSNNGVRGLSS